MKLLRFPVVIVISLALTVAAVAADFVHPGLINSSRSLTELSQLETENGNSARRESYSRLLEKDHRFAADYQPQPMAYVVVTAGGTNPKERRFRNDTIAAYFTALRWVETGDDRYRATSIAIMNAWAETFVALQNDVGTWPEQERLEAAWAVPIWTNAAEIILSYKPRQGVRTEWKDDDVRQFRRFVKRMHDRIGEIHNKPSNQGVSAALADMTLGVFDNDRPLYESGLRQMRELMPKIIHPDGEVKELRKRDCNHPQYSLVGFTQAAEIEMNQTGRSTLATLRRPGDTEPMLAAGIEYMARALNEGSDARDCRAKRLIDGFAPIALRLYGTDGRVKLRELHEVMDSGPARMSGLFPEGTAFTHGGP